MKMIFLLVELERTFVNVFWRKLDSLKASSKIPKVTTPSLTRAVINLIRNSLPSLVEKRSSTTETPKPDLFNDSQIDSGSATRLTKVMTEDQMDS